MYTAICEARDKAMDAVKPGITTHELDQIARDVLRSYGVESAFCHALGHGVGLEVHEGVTLSQLAPAKKILKNEIITIEPGVYFPGRFGMRVEEMIIVA
jgi:Xaa-Pro aminopeptidase